MTEDLRQRYAEALKRRLDPCSVNVPVSEPTATNSLTPGVLDLADAVMAVRDEELEQLRRWERIASKDNAQLREEVTRLRINAEKDVCSGCMQREEQRDNWMRATREYGVKYKQEKERVLKALDRAEKDERVIARVENLRDKWLAWPTDDMHYAAGLMLAKYLSDEPPALDDTAGTKNDHVEP